MTIEEIRADLMDLMARVANELPATPREGVPPELRAAQWAFIKGLALGEVGRQADRIAAFIKHSGL